MYHGRHPDLVHAKAIIPNEVRDLSSILDSSGIIHRYTNCVPSASLFTVQISMIAQIKLTTAA
jgi:hypothetical protein